MTFVAYREAEKHSTTHREYDSYVKLNRRCLFLKLIDTRPLELVAYMSVGSFTRKSAQQNS